MQDKEWMRAMQETADEWKQMRKQPQTCRWVSAGANCQQPTVGSHTIQRAGGLARVARNGNVVTWGLAGPKGIKFKTTSIRSATVFPGYCEDHEKVFRQAEDRGYLATKQDEVEQLLRSIDLAMFELEAGRDTFGQLVSDLVDRATKGEPGIDLTAAAELDGQFKDKEVALEELRTMRKSTQILYDARQFGSVPMFTKVFKETSPVCLTGLETVKTTLGRMPLVCCVFPEPKGTRVIFATRNKPLFWHNFKQHLVLWRPDTWKSSVRWWMTHGTDNWYLDPAVFERWSEEDKAAFQSEAEKQGGVPFMKATSVKLWDEDF